MVGPKGLFSVSSITLLLGLLVVVLILSLLLSFKEQEGEEAAKGGEEGRNEFRYSLFFCSSRISYSSSAILD